MKSKLLKGILTVSLAGVLCFGFAACEGGLTLDEAIQQALERAEGNLVSDRVTKEEWDAAFALENFENIKISVVEDYSQEYNGQTFNDKLEFTYIIANGICCVKAKVQDENGIIFHEVIPQGNYEEEIYLTASKNYDKFQGGTFLFPDFENKAKSYLKINDEKWVSGNSAILDYSDENGNRHYVVYTDNRYYVYTHATMMGSWLTRWLTSSGTEYAVRFFDLFTFSKEKGYYFEEERSNGGGSINFKFKDKKVVYLKYEDYSKNDNKAKKSITATATYGGQSIELPQFEEN